MQEATFEVSLCFIFEEEGGRNADSRMTSVKKDGQAKKSLLKMPLLLDMWDKSTRILQKRKKSQFIFSRVGRQFMKCNVKSW